MRKITAFFVLLSFLFSCIVPPQGFAQSLSAMELMPQPGVQVPLSPAFAPAQVKGMMVHPNNPFKLDFIISDGDEHIPQENKKFEYQKFIKYFLAALAIPDAEQWVNLSPFEQNSVIPDNFGKTEMGRDLLAQDYLLKQITATLTNPDTDLGKKFWDGVYAQAHEKFGTTDIPTDIVNKVWVVPSRASIYEKDNAVYVVDMHLKVMMDQDYLATKNFVDQASMESSDEAVRISQQLMREVVIPAIEKEVNEGRNFAPVRQIYGSALLAAWYKRSLKESILNKAYGDQSKVKGIDQDPATNRAIYDQYVAAFQKGVFNMIKEDVDKYSNQVIPRKYFSGGMVSPSVMFENAQVTRVEKDAFKKSLKKVGVAFTLVAALLVNSSDALAGSGVGMGGGTNLRAYRSESMPERMQHFLNRINTVPMVLPPIADKKETLRYEIIDIPQEYDKDLHLRKKWVGELEGQGKTEVFRLDGATREGPAIYSSSDYGIFSQLLAQIGIEGFFEQNYSNYTGKKEIVLYPRYEIRQELNRLKTTAFMSVGSVSPIVVHQGSHRTSNIPTAMVQEMNGFLQQMTYILPVGATDKMSEQIDVVKGRVADMIAVKFPNFPVEKEGVTVKQEGHMLTFSVGDFAQRNEESGEERIKKLIKDGNDLQAQLDAADHRKDLVEFWREMIAEDYFWKDSSGKAFVKRYLEGAAAFKMPEFKVQGRLFEGNPAEKHLKDGAVFAGQNLRVAKVIFAGSPAEKYLKDMEYLQLTWRARLLVWLGAALTRLGLKKADGSSADKDGTSVDKAAVGGIDLNTADLNLQIKRDGAGVPLPVSQQDLNSMRIDGLFPLILDIKSVSNLAALMP